MSKQQFSDRVRFNWGFHDAQHELDAALRQSDGGKRAMAGKHFDKAWQAGYRLGRDYYRRDGKRSQWSDEAWTEHTSN